MVAHYILELQPSDLQVQALTSPCVMDGLQRGQKYTVRGAAVSHRHRRGPFSEWSKPMDPQGK